MCEKGEVNMSGLDEALEGVDHLKYNLKDFSACPKLQCVFKEILLNKSISTTMIKDFCDKFDKKGLPIIAIGAQDFSTIGLPSNALALTTIEYTKLGRPYQVMQFNTLSCNKNPDPLDILETFQHESVHAIIKDKLLNKYSWNGQEANWEDYKYLAIQGIWDKDDKCSTNLISASKFGTLKTNFSKITNYFTFDKCD